jgi:subtilisin family serine protease
MIREYYVRGERKTVEEIDDVVAVKMTADERETAEEALGPEARVADAGIPTDALEAFRNAAWVFVEPSAEAERALEDPAAVDYADTAGKLVKRPNGRFGIVTRRLTVQLREDLSEKQAEQALADHGLRVLNRLRFAPNLFEVDTTAHRDALDASVELARDPGFVLAEPSLVEHLPVRSRPTDARYGEQWQWANIGRAGGTPGADVHAEAAWDRTRGAGIRVAVIDNGFNTAHEDLRAGVVARSGFFQSVGTAPPAFVQGTVGMPASNHGTFCAGLVGARQGNGRGGCGAAPECELYWWRASVTRSAPRPRWPAPWPTPLTPRPRSPGPTRPPEPTSSYPASGLTAPTGT